MTAHIIPFPARGPWAVRVGREDDARLVIARDHGWLHGDEDQALADAREIAAGFGVGVAITKELAQIVRGKSTADNSAVGKRTGKDGALTRRNIMQFDNTNRGAIFRDDGKTKETDRDYSGTLNVEGTEYWVSGWLKTSAKGVKFLSLSIKRKEAPTRENKKPAHASGGFYDDSIPF
jgi:hypothetical protein